jgi:hypothetical protein
MCNGSSNKDNPRLNNLKVKNKENPRLSNLRESRNPKRNHNTNSPKGNLKEGMQNIESRGTRGLNVAHYNICQAQQGDHNRQYSGSFWNKEQ